MISSASHSSSQRVIACAPLNTTTGGALDQLAQTGFSALADIMTLLQPSAEPLDPMLFGSSGRTISANAPSAAERLLLLILCSRSLSSLEQDPTRTMSQFQEVTKLSGSPPPSIACRNGSAADAVCRHR